MKCTACGRDNRAQAEFCAWCGQSFEPPEADADRTWDAPGSKEERPFWEDASRATVRLVPQEAEEAPIPEKDGEQSVAPELEVEAGPLPAGARVGDRYEIIELLESSPDHNRYRARDLCLCPRCGSDANQPEDAYCQACGAQREPASYAEIVEQLHHPPERFDLHLRERERDYYVTAEPRPQGALESEVIVARDGPRRLLWGWATHSGLQREHNEDYVEGWLYSRARGGLLGLFVVADGLGGQDSGEVASRMATEAVWSSLRQSVWEPIIRGESLAADALEERLRDAVLSANQQVYDARVSAGSAMSTTLTLALVVDDTAYIANVGDSRTYLWAAEGLQRVTRDHSLVQRLVEAGQLAADEVYTHPQRNLIYQSIGDRPEVQVDVFRHRLAVDDRLVLCSDGLWEMVREEGLEAVLLAELDPQRASERLIRDANLAGGEDNISVIVVRAVAE